MERGKRIETEFHLPELIIQHIQSFLTVREAARATLISKSWYAAWLTRPDLHFDQKDFARKPGNYETHRRGNAFYKFVKKTVVRYEKLNLKIHSLKLWIHGSYDMAHSLANKLIIQALKMGVTDLDFKIYCTDRLFALPYEVFRSENLVRLSVSGCRIGAGENGKIRFSSLKSLTLHNMYVEGDVIWDIISSCPLIENVSLSPSNVFAFKEFGKRIIRYEFHKLKCLLLSGIVVVHTLFLDDFSSKFPCLRDLALHRCFYSDQVIQISCSSLECINFIQDSMVKVKFDVPSIRKFTFSGSIIPCLLFTKTTSNWQSDISLKLPYPLDNATFLELNKFLKMLSLSKVSLSLDGLSMASLVYEVNIQGLCKPRTENMHSDFPALFHSLFRCCRPIYDIEIVYKKMMQQVCLNGCFAYQRKLSGESDLKEVCLEFYDEGVSAWRPRLFGTSTGLGSKKQRIRLRLRWGG